jgi:hypothetical protein
VHCKRASHTIGGIIRGAIANGVDSTATAPTIRRGVVARHLHQPTLVIHEDLDVALAADTVEHMFDEHLAIVRAARGHEDPTPGERHVGNSIRNPNHLGQLLLPPLDPPIHRIGIFERDIRAKRRDGQFRIFPRTIAGFPSH